MKIEQFESRKRDHIRLALDSSHQAHGLSGLQGIQLIHEALPELNLNEIDLSQDCFGLRLNTPFFIAGMTAGHADASQINDRLASAAEERGWAMGVGSQRRDLDLREESKAEWKTFRSRRSKLVVFANLGGAQLLHSGSDQVIRLGELLEANAICIHLNPLQEVIQPEGTPQFKGVLQAIENLARASKIPVIVKETGCGFSKSTLARLKNTGVAAVDVSGLGGTHWGRIEGSRSLEDAISAKASVTFSDWGISTVDSVLNAAETFAGQTKIKIWASGGVRSGLDAAKLIALGSDRVGYAQPALQAALQGSDALIEWMKLQEFELKTALFCTGSSSVEKLKGRKDVWTAKKV